MTLTSAGKDDDHQSLVKPTIYYFKSKSISLLLQIEGQMHGGVLEIQLIDNIPTDLLQYCISLWSNLENIFIKIHLPHPLPSQKLFHLPLLIPIFIWQTLS